MLSSVYRNQFFLRNDLSRWRSLLILCAVTSLFVWAGQSNADEPDPISSAQGSDVASDSVDTGDAETTSVVALEEPEAESVAFGLADDEELFDSSSTLEEVVVTSTKRETSLLSTPVAVSAFSQDDLDREKVLDITNIADLIPNVRIGESPSDSGVTISVRGISSNNFTEIGDPTVGIHVDGVFTPRPQAALALLHDVQRIEVNRGPQGTLFGRNSTAGSINIISARPQFDEYAGNYEIEYGSFANTTIRGWTNFAFSDGFAARLSFLYDVSGSYFNQKQDTYDFSWDDDGDGKFDGMYDLEPDRIANVDLRRSKPVSGKDVNGGVDRYGVRLSTLLSTSDSYKWLLSFDYFRDSSPGSFSVKDCEKAEGTYYACEGSQWDIEINTPGALDFRLFTLRTELIADITDNLRIEFRAGNSRQFRDQYYDSDGGARTDDGHPAYGLTRSGGAASAAYKAKYGEDADVAHLIQGGPNGDNQYILDVLGFSTVTLEPWNDLTLITRYSNYDSRVVELQFSSIADPDNAVEWIAGIFFMHEDNGIRFDVDSPLLAAAKHVIAQSFVQPNRDIESLAAFSQIEVPFSERFNMTFGLRWTLDQKSDTGGLSYGGNGAGYNTSAYTLTLDELKAGESAGFVDGNTGNRISPDAYSLVGLEKNPNLFQSDDFNLNQGTYSPEILDRLLFNTPNLTPNTFEDQWAQWTWKIGFDFAINESWFWYGYVATGYKAGGFTDNVDLCAGKCNPTPILNAFPYDPEKNTTFETGFKGVVFDSERAGRMNLIVTLFLSNVKDYQVTVFAQLTPAGTEFVVPNLPDADDIGTNPTRTAVVDNAVSNLITSNIGKSRNTGLEIEFDWNNPWPNGRIHGWISLLNAEILDLASSDGYYCLERAYLGLTPCPPSNPDIPDSLDTPGDESRVINFKGNKLPFAPEVALSVFIEHNFRFGDSGIRFSPYLSAHWSDEYFFDINNFDEGPLHNGQLPYWNFSLNLRLIDDNRNWAVEVYAHNLTDERVRVWQDNGPGFVRSNFVKPRNYGLKVVWGF